MVLNAMGRVAGEWIGHAEIKFTHSTTPMTLTDKSGKQTDLLSVCEQTVPPCHLNPLLFNGHLQNAWTLTKPHGPPVHYRRRIFQADHATYKGTFAVDFVVPPPEAGSDQGAAGEAGLGKDVPGEGAGGKLPPRTAWLGDDEFAAFGSNDSRPQLVVLHGLSGGSHEVYLRHAIEPLVRSGKWEVCVVNSRGCAMSTITSGVLYNARSTWDVRQTVKWLRETFPNRPLFGLGFSLGANILTNYAAEEGSSCLLSAAMVLSNPWNLELSSKMLQSTFIGKEIYLRVLGSAMYELASLHKKELQELTAVDWNVIEKMKYLHEFDQEVQCKTWGYPTVYSYYRDASSVDSVLAIKIPFCAINATDDPISVNAALPYEEFAKNPCTVLCTTSLGGHLSWFEPNGGRWFAKPVHNFFNHMAFEIDLDKIDTASASEPETTRNGHNFAAMRRRMQIG